MNCTSVLVATSVKLIANGYLTSQHIKFEHNAFSRYRETDTHSRTCWFTSPLNFVRSLRNGSLTTHRNSAQSIQPFPRYARASTPARAYIRAHVLMYTTHDLCSVHGYLSPKHTPNLVKIGPSILNYSTAINSYSSHVARPTCTRLSLQMRAARLCSNCIELAYSSVKTAWK